MNRNLGPQFFHRSDSDLKPGQTLLPAAERGHESQWGHLDTYDPNHVYFYEGKRTGPAEQRHEVRHYFGPKLGRHVYEVEPLGDVKPDPEGGARGRAKMAPRARVVRQVVDGGPAPAPYCSTCHIPPGMRGENWKPHPHA